MRLPRSRFPRNFRVRDAAYAVIVASIAFGWISFVRSNRTDSPDKDNGAYVTFLFLVVTSVVVPWFLYRRSR